MNRLVSNFILGFFVLALMAVYGFAKQPTVYSVLTHKSQPATDPATQSTRRIVLPDGTTIAARLAETDESRQRGLSGVEQLETNTGMLFVFDDPGIHSMWMKDMKVPIDMLWLDDQGRVVYLAAKVQPDADQGETPTYSNDEPARYVLEVPAGTVEAAQLKEGDTLEIASSI